MIFQWSYRSAMIWIHLLVVLFFDCKIHANHNEGDEVALQETSIKNNSATICQILITNPVNLVNCDIIELDPYCLQHNHGVTSLNMSHNRNFDFPPDGSPFLIHPKLMNYYCKGCGITSIYKGTFSALRQLILVDLRWNRIKQIPAETFNFNQIQFMYLAGNEIGEFNEKDELETMQHLVTLDASDNQNVKLYGLSMDFRNLEWITCRNCSLNSLDDQWFAKVGRLKKLDLENNLIQNVSKMCFGGNSRLYYLNLDGNPVEVLEITSKSLEILTCNGCNLTELSANTFRDLPNLKTMELKNNQIQTVYLETFSLRKLLLDNNYLSTFPSEVLKTSLSLKILCLDHNPIEVTHEFNRFKHLYKMYHLRHDCATRGNSLHHFENFMPDSIPNGKIAYLKDFPSCVEHVNISNQNIVFIHPMAFEDCPTLESFEMNHNYNFTFHAHHSFLYNQFLKSYSCQHCGIHTVYRETFANLPELSSIYLQNNHLKEMFSLNIFPPKLTNLKLAGNHLELLPMEMFSQQNSLSEIDLNHNKNLWQGIIHPLLLQSSVTTLHAAHCALNEITNFTFILMTSLEEIDVADNPITAVDHGAFVRNQKLRILRLENTLLHVFPVQAIEPLNQLRFLCLAELKEYRFQAEETVTRNNLRLRVLLQDRNLSCKEGKQFVEQLNRIPNISAINTEEDASNGSKQHRELAIMMCVIIVSILSVKTIL